MSDEWQRPTNPPPPLYFGKKERDFVKHINDEIYERILNQTVFYYAVDLNTTQYHKVYGEAIHKTFLPPVRVHTAISWEGSEDFISDPFSVDNTASINVHFHKRRLTEDQDLFTRVGDFLLYGERYYEIVKLSKPRLLYGQVEFEFEIVATCIRSRKNLFDGK